MSIHFITGIPGAGKGILSAHMIIEELRSTDRPIITNFAVELLPWVAGKKKPKAQMGLLPYLRFKYGQTFNAENRIFRVSDEEIAEFYLYRAIPIAREDTELMKFRLEKADCVRKVSKDGSDGAVMEFQTNWLAEGGHLIVIDEAWKFYSSRNWQKTGEGVLFYNAQHRKVGDDLLICTQNTKQVDPALHRLAEDFSHCVNRGRRSIGKFRQPSGIKVEVYSDAPTGSQQSPMRTDVLEIDKEGICQTYDTTAGVGLSGRMDGDMNKKPKGFPFWMLIAGVILCGLAAILVLKYGVLKGSTAAMRHMVAKSVPSVRSAPEKPVSSKTALPEIPREKADPKNSDSEEISDSKSIEPVLEMFGFSIQNGIATIFLSDGSRRNSSELEFRGVNRQQAIFTDGIYKMRKPVYETDLPKKNRPMRKLSATH